MNSYPAELVYQHFPCMLVAGLINSNQSNSTSTSTPSTTTTTSATASSANATPSPSKSFPSLTKDLVEIFGARGKNAVWDPARGGAAVFKSVMVDHHVRLPPRKTRPSPRSVASPIPTSDPNSTDNPTSSSSTSALSSLPARSPLSPLHPGSPLFPDGIIAPIWLRKHRELVPSVFVAFHCLAEPPPLVSVSVSSNDSETINQVEGSGLEVSTMEELKSKDEELIKTIAERKRSLVERGIKLTVVLLTSRSMLENPQLEARLSHLRRSSGLDSKASLFVLTPVSRNELGEFVTSLQGALYDSSLDFYREHSRRIRRKRPRYPPPPSLVQPILNAVSSTSGGSSQSNPLVPLSREGWQVRAEYKLATFAEMQGDNETAMSHYLEAYDILANNLLGSTMHLPPRTKRWAEAKVLADALSIRISKLHLYNDDGLKAKVQFEKHVHRFVELSTGWGIGEATFEFWSWLGKQYRMFGDLIDVATREIPGAPLPPFNLPIHAPPLPSNILHPLLVSSANSEGLDIRYLYPGLHAPSPTATGSGISPSSLLQGAGGFYYLAALCSIERRERFLQMEKKEMEINGKETYLEKQPALAHEKKIDHLGQITEALTRAYEAFKRVRQTRLSLFVASKIAFSYHANGQSEMALRFLERIAKTYRKECWYSPLASLLSIASECAKNAGEVASRVKILVELLSPEVPLSSQQRINAASELRDLLKNESLPEGKGPLNINFGESIEKDREEEVTSQPSSSTTTPSFKGGFIKLENVFYSQEIEFGSSVPFQVQLSAPDSGAHEALEQLEFDALQIFFQQDVGSEEDENRGEDQLCAVVKNGEKKERVQSEVVSLGALTLRGEVVESQADLRWSEGSTKTFAGVLSSNAAASVRFSHAVLIAGGDRVPIHISVFPPRPDPFSSPQQSNWFVPSKSKSASRSALRSIKLPHRSQPDVVRIKPRRHKVDLKLIHEKEVFLDEEFEIKVEVKNQETEDLICQVDVELADLGSSSDGRAFDFISCGDSKDPFSLKDLSLGTLNPSASDTLSVHLHTSQIATPRSLNIILKSRSSSSSSTSANSEIIETIQLLVQPPFAEKILPRWSVKRERNASKRRHEARKARSLAIDEDDLTDSDDDEETLQVERSARATLCASFTSLASQPLEIQSISLKLDESSSDVWSVPGGEEVAFDVSGIWERGDTFSTIHEVEAICRGDEPTHFQEAQVSARSYYEIKWRRVSSSSNYFTTVIPLPSLIPPKTEIGPSILISPPSTVKLNIPFNLPIIVSNSSNRSSDILISLESTESFIFSGPRTLSIPNLLSETEREIQLRLVPVVIGKGSLPRIRAWDRNQMEKEGEEGRPVRVQSSSRAQFVLVQ